MNNKEIKSITEFSEGFNERLSKMMMEQSLTGKSGCRVELIDSEVHMTDVTPLMDSLNIKL